MSGRNVIRFDFRSGLFVMGRLVLTGGADLDSHNPIVERSLAEDSGLHHKFEVNIGSADKMGLREALSSPTGGSGVVDDLEPL